jgi:hypothetical protein
MRSWPEARLNLLPDDGPDLADSQAQGGSAVSPRVSALHPVDGSSVGERGDLPLESGVARAVRWARNAM